jgi:hypothetical protein
MIPVEADTYPARDLAGRRCVCRLRGPFERSTDGPGRSQDRNTSGGGDGRRST